jgi:hypothetical protein
LRLRTSVIDFLKVSQLLCNHTVVLEGLVLDRLAWTVLVRKPCLLALGDFVVSSGEVVVVIIIVIV